MEFTKGPWTHSKHTGGSYLISQDKGEPVVASVGRNGQKHCILNNEQNIATIIPCFGMTEEEVQANARLIAAAPLMYKALLAFISADNFPVHLENATYYAEYLLRKINGE